jgi:hypothetical protein
MFLKELLQNSVHLKVKTERMTPIRITRKMYTHAYTHTNTHTHTHTYTHTHHFFKEVNSNYKIKFKTVLEVVSTSICPVVPVLVLSATLPFLFLLEGGLYQAE